MSEPYHVDQRTVRVFISSTFRDMHNEREELVKFIFPELRKRCRERQVEFADVDLRWGITDEQKAEGKVLPICLAEIERCRPYFIGLLGERYGWVPEVIDKELAEVQPWLEEHEEKSVTELEIVHGVLKNPEMKRLAFFYLRSPETSNQIENELSKETVYRAEPEASLLKLKSLKEEIRKSGYPVRDDYSDAKQLGQLVLEDLWKVIDERFPKEEVPSPLERERMEHEAFAESRRKVYIGKDEYYKRLDEHVLRYDPPLVLLGESGSGKSALLANWAERYRNEYPDDFMVLHFIGSTSDSADYVRLLQRIMEEIKGRYEPSTSQLTPSPFDPSLSPLAKGGITGGGAFSEEIPTDPKKVVEAFPLWLAKAAARGRMVLVIDALNQLEDRDNAPDLGWLPEYFPPTIRVILSTLPGRSLEALKRRNLPVCTIQPLGKDERKEFTKEYLEQYRKKLNDAQAERVSSAEQSANPLFLRTLLEELRVFGIHEELDNRITHYLTAKTVDDLFELVLERYEQVYERDSVALVRDSMSLIWASRRGLSESELMDLLGSDGKPLPRAYWSPLFLAAEESLVSRSGLLNFFHDFLRKAVEQRYLNTEESKKNFHLRIADYFENREIDERKVDELPWQLKEANEWRRLKETLIDIEMFQKLIDKKRDYELIRYWLTIQNLFDMVSEYSAAINRYEESVTLIYELPFIINRIAVFLELCDKYDGGEVLSRRALVIAERIFGENHPEAARSLHNVAAFLCRKGKYDEAEPIYRRALSIYEESSEVALQDKAATLNNLASLLHDKDCFDEAEELYRRALAIRKDILGLENMDVAESLNNLGLLLLEKGQYDEAESIFRKALIILEKNVGATHLHVAKILNNLTAIHEVKGAYGEAEQLCLRTLDIEERIIGSDGLVIANTLDQLSGLLLRKGSLSEAENLSRRALSIREKRLTFNHPDLAISLTKLALILQIKGAFDEAEVLYRNAFEVCKKAFGENHHKTATSISNIGFILEKKGDIGAAEQQYRRALAIYKRVLGTEHSSTMELLFHLAQVLRDKGNLTESAELYNHLLERGEEILNKHASIWPDFMFIMAASHNNIAFHTDVPVRNWKEAEYHYQKSIEFFKEYQKPLETANVELNLLTLYRLAGRESGKKWPTVDISRVKELTRILEDANDPRAEKGHQLLKELNNG